MMVGPSEPVNMRRLQTTLSSCFLREMVVSVKEKACKRHVMLKEMNASEPLKRCRKGLVFAKTRGSYAQLGIARRVHMFCSCGKRHRGGMNFNKGLIRNLGTSMKPTTGRGG